MVCRNPCYHPGDIRVLEATHVQGYEHAVDELRLPVQGPRPHADEMSGGDLDGDKFTVL